MSVPGSQGRFEIDVVERVRWLIQRNVVVIPKSVRRDRMAENLDVFEYELTAEQMDRIAALDTGVSAFFDHRDPEVASRIGGRRS